MRKMRFCFLIVKPPPKKLSIDIRERFRLEIGDRGPAAVMMTRRTECSRFNVPCKKLRLNKKKADRCEYINQYQGDDLTKKYVPKNTDDATKWTLAIELNHF